MKKRNLALLRTAAAVSLILAGAAAAQSDEVRYYYKSKSDKQGTPLEWCTTGFSYGPWSNVGGHYACQAWTPDPSTVRWG